MHLYKTIEGAVLRHSRKSFLLQDDWDVLITQTNLFHHLMQLAKNATSILEERADDLITNRLLPPIVSQEVWAAGVTYLRSRDARMDESKDAGAADCYQRVYEAERPELFFKSLPHRDRRKRRFERPRRRCAFSS